MIVDDLAINRRILSKRLACWGMKSVMATSGDEGLQCLKSANKSNDTIDVIVSDYQMPGMDGEAFCRAVRRIPKYATTPILVFSSVDQSLTPEMKKQIENCDLMLKPVRSSVLRSNISKLLENAKPATVVPKQVAKTQMAAKTTPVTELGSKINLLVAEDNKTNQLVVKTMLKGADINLTFASDGAEAVKLYQD